jgi:hypothetical protein
VDLCVCNYIYIYIYIFIHIYIYIYTYIDIYMYWAGGTASRGSLGLAQVPTPLSCKTAAIHAVQVCLDQRLVVLYSADQKRALELRPVRPEAGL